jgi:hypothetical protein
VRALLAVLAFSMGVLCGQEDPKIAQWIRDLSDDSVEVRERATEELVRLGRAVEKPLRGAAKDGNEELRARVSQVFAEIERREKLRSYDGGPSLVTLVKKDAPLREVLAEIARQSKTKISFKDVPGKDQVSVRFDRTPVFAALDTLCRDHGGIRCDFRQAADEDEEGDVKPSFSGLSVRAYAPTWSVSVSSGKYVELARQFSDQYAVRLRSIHLNRTRMFLTGAGKATTTIDFDLAWEAGTKPISAVVVIEDLVDDTGASYGDLFKKDLSFAGMAFSEGILIHSNPSMERVPPDRAARFSRLKGFAEMTLPESEDEFVFDDPASKGGVARAAGRSSVKLLTYVRKKEMVEVKVEVRPASLEEKLNLRVLDKSGREYGNLGMSSSGEGDSVTLEVEFEVPEKIEVTALKASVVTAVRSRKIPFDFKDVRFR